MGVPTGRSRALSITGHAASQVWTQAAPSGSPWGIPAQSIVHQPMAGFAYFGGAAVFAPISGTQAIETRPKPGAPSITQERLAWTVTLGAVSGVSAVQTVYSAWYDPTDWVGFTGAVAGSATADVTESATLVEEHGGVETRTSRSLNVAAAGTLSIDLIKMVSGLPVVIETVTASVSLSQTTTPADAAMGSYGGMLLFNCAAPATPFLGSTSVGNVQGGFTTGSGVRAAVSIGASGLAYPTDAITATQGGSTLTGSPLDATFSYTGPGLYTADTTPYAGGLSSGVFWNSWTWPYASIQFDANWSAKVTFLDQRWGTGEAVPVAIEHWGTPSGFGAVPTLLGSVTSPGPYRFPGTTLETLIVQLSDGVIRATDSNDPFHPGAISLVINSLTSAGGVTTATSSLKIYDGPTTSGTMDVRNPFLSYTPGFAPGVGPTASNQWFTPANSWADGYGTYLDSDNRPGARRNYVFDTTPYVNPFSLAVAATHVFSALANPAGWTGGTVAAGSSGLVFTAAGGGTTWFTRSGYTWRDYVYRYLSLTARTSDAVTLQIGVSVPGAGAPARVWTLRPAADGTPQACAWDWAFGDGETAATHLDGRGIGQGWQLWIGIAGAGSVELWDLTGAIRTGADRKGLAILGPIRALGDRGGALTDYEHNGISGTAQKALYRVVANGLRGPLFLEDLSVTFYAYWSVVAAALDTAANDTGISFTAASTPATNAFGGDYVFPAGSCSQVLTPGTPFSPQGRATATVLYGYPGMGDPEGAYGAELVYQARKLWDGQIAGQVYDHGASAAGVVVELRDNNTGSLVAAGTADADGLVEIDAKYGVVRTYANDGSFQGDGSGGSPYTALGRLLNAYWITGDALTGAKDGAGYLVTGGLFGTRTPFVLLDRYPSWYDFGGVGSGAEVDLIRHSLPDRRLLVARIQAGTLVVDRYSDAETDTVQATATVDAGPGCSAPTLALRRDGSFWIVYGRDPGIYLATSRDRGRSWTVATTVAAAGYSRPVFEWVQALDGREMPVVLLWAGNRWFVSVGTLDAGGTWTFSSPRDLGVTAAPVRGGLRQRRDGTLEFVYQTAAGAVAIVRCPALASSGAGTWS